MFILPYVYHRRILPHVTLYEISVLTVNGSELWKEPDHLSITKDVLEPNGFTALACHWYKDIAYCHLDRTRLNMEEYFQWKEIPVRSCDDETFCWRTYYLVTSPTAPKENVHDMWLPVPSRESLGPYPSHELMRELLQRIATATATITS